MIMKFLKKIPAGMMVVPMLLGAFINTFFPQITGIGSFTTAIFTSAGANTAIGIQLFCLGTTLRFREIGGVVKRGGVLLISAIYSMVFFKEKPTAAKISGILLAAASITVLSI